MSTTVNMHDPVAVRASRYTAPLFATLEFTDGQGNLVIGDA